MKSVLQKHHKLLVTSLIALVLIAILIAIPTGYEDALIYQGTERAIGKVVSVDNSAIKSSGLIQSANKAVKLKMVFLKDNN